MKSKRYAKKKIIHLKRLEIKMHFNFPIRCCVWRKKYTLKDILKKSNLRNLYRKKNFIFKKKRYLEIFFNGNCLLMNSKISSFFYTLNFPGKKSVNVIDILITYQW